MVLGQGFIYLEIQREMYWEKGCKREKQSLVSCSFPWKNKEKGLGKRGITKRSSLWPVVHFHGKMKRKKKKRYNKEEQSLVSGSFPWKNKEKGLGKSVCQMRVVLKLGFHCIDFTNIFIFV